MRSSSDVSNASVSSTASADPVLSVRNLRVEFDTRRGRVRAVDGVSFTLNAGETLGLVGESGCGKTVTALSLLRSVPAPGKIDGGTIEFEGRNLLSISERDMTRLRGKRIALIPQDPLTALNPVMTVGDHLVEVLDIISACVVKPPGRVPLISCPGSGFPNRGSGLMRIPTNFLGACVKG